MSLENLRKICLNLSLLIVSFILINLLSKLLVLYIRVVTRYIFSLLIPIFSSKFWSLIPEWSKIWSLIEMLQQKYNWISKGCRSFQLRRISELCGLCCYVWKPDPWTPYSATDPDPMACDSRSQRCDPWSHPIFCCWSLIPYTLLRPCLYWIDCLPIS